MTEVDSKKLKKVIERVQKLFNRAEHAVQDADTPEKVDHEAQAALELARKLMLQYNIEMEDVEVVGAVKPGQGPEADGVVIDMKTQRTVKWALSLAIVVADYMDASVVYFEPDYWSGGRMLFHGVKLNAHMAAFAFQSVFNQVTELSRKYRVSREDYDGGGRSQGLMRSLMSSLAQHNYSTFDAYRNAAKREYREGLVHGFARRLKELKEQEQTSGESEQITALAVRYEGIAKAWLHDQGFGDGGEKKPRPRSKHTGVKHYQDGERDSEHVQIRKGLGEK